MIEMPFREGTLVWVTSLHSYITLHVMDSHWHCLANVDLWIYQCMAVVWPYVKLL